MSETGSGSSGRCQGVRKRLLSLRVFHSDARYLALLVSLLLLVVLPTIFGAGKRVASIRLLDIWSCIILLAAVFAISEKKGVFTIALFLAAPMLVTTSLGYFVETTPVYVCSHALTILFFAFIACVILRDVLRTGAITNDKIIGAICVYLFIGIIWGFLYSLTSYLEPDSFHVEHILGDADSDTVLGRRMSSGFIYYSFVTLTTLGYGDITPMRPSSRMLAWMEAVTGQLYIAILVARLVALHITQSYAKRES